MGTWNAPLVPPFQSNIPRFTGVTGAEARIELISWHRKLAIKKIRLPKIYRNTELDKQLRTRRTKGEVQILHWAKLARVDCPLVYFADPARAEIVMEYVEGNLLKDLDDPSGNQLSNESQRANLNTMFESLGRSAARLHVKDIIHGDLTTKNIIVSSARSGPVLIDFGLSFISERLEDRAEDLHLLKQALISSTDSKTATTRFRRFLNGYSSVVSATEAALITRQMTEIERRGRYARVD